jgi:hypothetical protein
MLYVGEGRRDGNRVATWKTRCKQDLEEGTFGQARRRCMRADGKER